MKRFAAVLFLVGCSASGGAVLDRAEPAPVDGSAPAGAASLGAGTGGQSGADTPAGGGSGGVPLGGAAGARAEGGTGGTAAGAAGNPFGGASGAGMGGLAGAPQAGSSAAAGTAGGPPSDGRSFDCTQVPGWNYQCPASAVEYPICHCIVSAKMCVGTSPAGTGHCWSYSIVRQGVAIHGVPAGLLCEIGDYADNCAAADAALSEACGCGE